MPNDGVQDTGTAEATALPDFIIDKFKGAENPLEAQARAYSEAQALIGRKEADIETALRPKLEATLREQMARDLGIPEKPDAYKLPDDWNAEHPMAKEILGKFHAAGFGQKQLDATFELYKALAPDPAAEMAKLGDTADERVKAVEGFINQMLPEEMIPVAKGLLSMADGVQMFEAIMEKTQASVLPGSDGEGASILKSKPTQEGLVQLMRDPRYSDPAKRNPVYIAQVEKYAREIQ